MMIEVAFLLIFVIILSIAVYHVAQFSTKETPFEEALAEQRQSRKIEILPFKIEKYQKKYKEKGKHKQMDAKEKENKSAREERLRKFGKENKKSESIKINKINNKKEDKKLIESITEDKIQLEIFQNDMNCKKCEVSKNKNVEKECKRVIECQEKLEIFFFDNAEKRVSEKWEIKKKATDNEKLNEGKKLEKINEKVNAIKTIKIGKIIVDKEKMKETEKANEILERYIHKKLIGANNDKENMMVKKEEKFYGKEKKMNEKKNNIKEIENKLNEKQNKYDIEEGKNIPKLDKKNNGKKEKYRASEIIERISDKKKHETFQNTLNKNEREFENVNVKLERVRDSEKLFAKFKNANSENNRNKNEGALKIKNERDVNKKKELNAKKENEKISYCVSDLKLVSLNLKLNAAQPKEEALFKEIKLETSGRRETELSSKTKEKVSSCMKTKNNKDSRVGGKLSDSDSDLQLKHKCERNNPLTGSQEVNAIGLEIQRSEPKKSERKRLVSFSDDAIAKLLSVIQKSQLSGGEIQLLIETLLNKQQLSGRLGGEWVEKGKAVDPIIQLKRQLEESEAKLKEQIDSHYTLSAKISDLRIDLNTERGRNNTLKKQLDNSDILLQQKLDAAAVLHREQFVATLNDTKFTLNKEYKIKLLEKQQTIKKENELQVQKLNSSIFDLEKVLQQANIAHQEAELKYQLIQGTLADTEQKLNSLIKEREELMKQCQNFQQHLSTLKDQTTQQQEEVNVRLYEIQQKLSASEASNLQIKMQLTQSNNEKESLNQQIKNLENIRDLLTQNQIKLKRTLFDKGELEKRMLTAEHDLSKFREVANIQKLEVERLKEEKVSLASQVIRPSAEGQENGDLHIEDNFINNPHNIIHTEPFSKEISRLKEDYSFMKRKNSEQVEEFQKILNCTKASLIRIYPTLQSKENFDHSAFLHEVEKAASSINEKSNVVEVKTQIVEKIVEKVVCDPKLERQLEEMKKENASLQVKIEMLLEEKLSLENTLKSPSLEDKADLIQDLQMENKSLAEKVANYQDILSNTESLLRTLQKSVESEESTWQEKLLEKEESLLQLSADKKSLTMQVSELNASLERVKQAEEAAAHLCDLQFAYNCMEKSLPSILSQMESQLNFLKEKLALEEKAKEKLEDELIRTKEKLKSCKFTEVSSNGVSNGTNFNEDEISQSDTASLVSSEERVSNAQAEDAIKKKKKKKNERAAINE